MESATTPLTYLWGRYFSTHGIPESISSRRVNIFAGAMIFSLSMVNDSSGCCQHFPTRKIVLHEFCIPQVSNTSTSTGINYQRARRNSARQDPSFFHSSAWVPLRHSKTRASSPPNICWNFRCCSVQLRCDCSLA